MATTKNQEIKDQIDQLQDRIRRAPALTPMETIFQWYLQIEDLEKEYEPDGRQDRENTGEDVDEKLSDGSRERARRDMGEPAADNRRENNGKDVPETISGTKYVNYESRGHEVNVINEDKEILREADRWEE